MADTPTPMCEATNYMGRCISPAGHAGYHHAQRGPGGCYGALLWADAPVAHDPPSSLPIDGKPSPRLDVNVLRMTENLAREQEWYHRGAEDAAQVCYSRSFSVTDPTAANEAHKCGGAIRLACQVPVNIRRPDYPPSSPQKPPFRPVHRRGSDATQVASSQCIVETMAEKSDELSPKQLPDSPPSSSPATPSSASTSSSASSSPLSSSEPATERTFSEVLDRGTRDPLSSSSSPSPQDATSIAEHYCEGYLDGSQVAVRAALKAPNFEARAWRESLAEAEAAAAEYVAKRAAETSETPT